MTKENIAHLSVLLLCKCNIMLHAYIKKNDGSSTSVGGDVGCLGMDRLRDGEVEGVCKLRARPLQHGPLHQTSLTVPGHRFQRPFALGLVQCPT